MFPKQLLNLFISLCKIMMGILYLEYLFWLHSAEKVYEWHDGALPNSSKNYKSDKKRLHIAKTKLGKNNSLTKFLILGKTLVKYVKV